MCELHASEVTEDRIMVLNGHRTASEHECKYIIYIYHFTTRGFEHKRIVTGKDLGVSASMCYEQLK